MKKNRDDKNNRDNIVSQICIEGDYGGHDVFSGKCSYIGKTTVWTQAGDDLEGNANGNPACDIIISDNIKLMTSDNSTIEWDFPKDKEEMKKINSEINAALEKFYSQYSRQKAFVEK